MPATEVDRRDTNDAQAEPPAPAARAGERPKGRHADRPGELPGAAWADIVRRVAREIKADNVPLLSAGVAFFALLALFPAMVAVISVYGLVADPDDVTRQVRDLTAALPPEARSLVVDQMNQIAGEAPSRLGTSAVIGIVLALWSASAGMRWLLSALSLAYDETEERGFLRLRGTALVLTVAAAAAFGVNLVLVTAAGRIARWLGLSGTGETVVSALRWPLLAVLIAGGLAVLYRYGPDRDDARWRWVTWGSVVATVLAVVASAGLAVYASLSDGLDETYGSLGGVIVLMLWLLVSVLAIMVGAELNAEMEHQTARDTTSGDTQPLGSRGATDADEVAPSPR